MKSKYYFILGCILALFWILLSGHTTILLLGLGLASVVLVTWLMSRMDRNDNASANILFSLEFLSYLGWLAWQVIITNIDVAKRIWNPSLPIKPDCRKIKVDIKDPLIKTIYANSITLTPGTVTTEIGENYFIVHALNSESLDEIEDGEMERRLISLEERK
ncbi:MAG: Na+/H+ antiporter subunit E [Campylobacterota bacterium]|nr:Na+/H+ antiporter subunit E [Campylobacterota bacterium]